MHGLQARDRTHFFPARIERGVEHCLQEAHRFTHHRFVSIAFLHSRSYYFSLSPFLRGITHNRYIHTVVLVLGAESSSFFF